jgi:hypothetical protein
MRNSTKLLLALAVTFSYHGRSLAQTTITQWNFNSNPADANTATGSLTPSTGSGTITPLGVTASFNNGAANGGSSDIAPAGDNSGWHTLDYPAQGTADKTRGIQFAVSTAGFQNISVRYDVRHSNTSSRYELLQYTTDITAATPVWVDAQVFDGNAGDTWFNNRTVNLSSVAALNNNTKAGFRVVSVFAPSTSAYAPSNNGSTYAATGTWRFDMVTVSAGAVVPPPAVSFVGSQTSVNETTGTVTVNANLSNGNGLPSSVDVELVPFNTATQSLDFSAPVSMQLNWPAGSHNVTQGLTFSIANDILSENAEYFVLRLVNPVNVNLPSNANNVFTVFIIDNDKQAPVASQTIKLNHITSFSNGLPSGPNSAEIVAYDPGSKRLFIANSLGAKLDIVNFSNPAAPVLITSIPVSPYGNINSVAVRNGIVAAAIENATPQQNGKVVFFDTNGNFLNQVTVGAMPDMITFNHAGTKVLTANEGEPNTTYSADPEGSVSIIDISGGIGSLTQANVTNVDFAAYNSQLNALKAAGIRIFGPGATVAKDMEPEYITISEDDNTAWVSCQENNAIAVVNIATGTITDIKPLGTKDHALLSNALDVSDNSGAIQIANWPIKGVYMPDAIASYKIGGQEYIITTNEGDAREYNAITEINRLSSAAYVLDPIAFPYANVIKSNLGRLNVTFASGDTDGDGDYDEIHTFGGRSISIWNATTGTLVWDSGDMMELITGKHPQLAALFNASNANNTLKNRSDDKGPEPEGVALATIYGRIYAFVALERIGGCMVFDVTDPSNPVFVDYRNTRTLTAYGGDQGAEGVIYIKPTQSPDGKPYVILANEISSTLGIFEVEVTCPDYVADIAVNPSPTVAGQLPNTIYLGYGPQSVTLSASVTPAYGAFTYAWSPVNGTMSQVNVAPQSTTNYTVTATDEYGCTATDQQLVKVIDIRDGNKNKVFICHNGNTNSVSVNAVPAHLAHGDMLGNCNLLSSYAKHAAPESEEHQEEGVAAIAVTQLALTPNPVQSVAYITVPLEKEEVIEVRVVDAAGKLVIKPIRKNLAIGQQIELNTAILSAGIYFVQVSYSATTEVLKMVVAN